MTTVEKEQFWTQIVENPSLWGTIQTSDKSFNTQAENIWTVMNETFIKNGSLKEVNRWELMLGDRLENSGEGTLNERKARILKRITEHPPVTKKMLKDVLEKIIPERYGYVFKSEYDKFSDTFDFIAACKEEDKEVISKIISNTIPEIKNINISYNDINKYAECTTLAEIAAIDSNFRVDLTSDGGWVYPLKKLTSLASFAYGGGYSPNMTIRFINCDAPSVTKTNPGFVHSSVPYWAKGDWSGVIDGTWMFGAPYDNRLYDVDMIFPNLDKGTDMFTGAVLNKKSVIRILRSIPSYDSGSHPLTIGIHIDNKMDEEIASVISETEMKGWQLTIQWNGKATSQSASMYVYSRDTIYAKLGLLEFPNGVVETYLNWGHYVTNWEENGYQEFSSLEEAYEHFGIEPEV